MSSNAETEDDAVLNKGNPDELDTSASNVLESSGYCSSSVQETSSSTSPSSSSSSSAEYSITNSDINMDGVLDLDNVATDQESVSTTATDEESAAKDEESAAKDEESAATDEESAAKDEESAAKHEESTVKDEELAAKDAKDEESAAKDEESAAKDEELAGNDEESAAKDEESAAKDEESADKDEESADKDEDSAAKNEESADKDDDLAAKDEESAAKDEELAAKDANNEESTSKDGELAATKEESAAKEGESAATDGESATIDGESATTEQESVPTEQGSANTEHEPAVTEQELVCTHADDLEQKSALAEQESSSTDGESAAKDGESEAKDEESAAKDEKSAAKDEKSAAKDEEAASKDEEAASKDEEAAATDEELAAKDEELAAKDGESAAIHKESAAKDEESAAQDANNEESTSKDGELAATKEESAAIEGESAATDGESAAKDEESATTEQESVPTEQESVITEHEPAVTEQELVCTHADDSEQKSASAEQESSSTDGESAATDGESAATDGESAATDGESAAKDEESAAKDEESAAKDEESAKDKELSATDWESAAQDEESAPKDEESAATEHESAPTEQESVPTEQEFVPTEQEFATKEVSTATERDFVCACPDNSEQESAPAEKESSATDGALAATDGESATKDEESATKEQESAPAEQESVPTEQESVPTKQEPAISEQELVYTHAEDSKQKSALAEQESNSTDGESAATDGESAPKDEVSAATEQESVPTEQESATKEEESAATERDLVCACADNSEQETSVTEQETKRCREKTVFDVVQELKTTENKYLSIFKLLKKHYKDHHVHGLLYEDQPQIVHDTLMHIPDIYDVTKNILEAVSNRVDNWHFCPAIADIFIEYGPYLEAYSHYMVGFKQLKKKDLKYIDWTICFESGWQEKCQNLSVERLFSAPLQKLSLYQQFLTEYLKYLTVDCGEYQRTKGALAILDDINNKVTRKSGECMNEVCINETQFGIIQELKNTESNYLKILKLLHEHFKENQVQGPAYGDQTHIINEILGHLPDIIEVTENFLIALTKRCTDWPFCPSMADLFIEYGPSLKVYSHYIAGFKQLKRDDLQSFDWNKCIKVEWQEKCHNAPIEHLFAAPVKRLPRYQILLTEYLNHFTMNCWESQQTKDALAILDDVNNQVDEAIKQYETEESKNATAFRIIHEFKNTETCYFNILKLLNVDYRTYLQHELSDEEPKKHIVNENLKHLSDIQDVTEKIVTAISERIDHWQICPALADIFLEYGPSLKVYRHYITGYESRIAEFKQMRKDDPKFDEWNKNFEAKQLEDCYKLPIEELLSFPVMRLPTYKCLLTNYLEYLTVHCGEYQRTKDALAILDEVNDQADQMETEESKNAIALRIVDEFKNSEMGYLNILKLLNVDYKAYLAHELSDEEPTKHIVNENLKHLSDIQDVTEKIVTAISKRTDLWHFCPALADIFLEYGPSMNVYIDYIAGYESRIAEFKQMRKDDPKFDEWNKSFEAEWQEKSQNLPIEELFSAPVKRLPTYKLLLTEYLKHLTVDCGEYQRTKDALAVLDEVNQMIPECPKKAAFDLIHEFKNTERHYLNILKLLAQDYKEGEEQGLTYGDQSDIIHETMKNLPDIQEVTRNVVTATCKRVDNWHFCPALADIFLEYGPSMKAYSHYIAGFNQLKIEFVDWNECFDAEWQERCHNLPIEQLFSAPVKRLPQYQLLLREYLKHLTVDCGEYQRTKDALAILDEINNQATQMETDNIVPDLVQEKTDDMVPDIVQEIKATEINYLTILKLLNKDYRAYQAHGLPDGNQAKNLVNENLKHLPAVQDMSENILTAISERITRWHFCPALADIFLEHGPLMQALSLHITEDESNLAKFKEMRKDDPMFDDWNKTFEVEWQETCQKLPIEELFCAPVKRLSQYQLLLTEYLHQLTADCGEYQRTKDALAILDEVLKNQVDQVETKETAFDIIQEIKTTETDYFNIIKLLNKNYRAYQADGLTDEDQTKHIVNENLKHLPSIQDVTENILKAISKRIDMWHFCPALADIFLEYGPSMKVYSPHIAENESNFIKFTQMRKIDPKFDKWNETFEVEWQEACHNLPVEELFCAPVKRLSQYQHFLTEYLKHLTVDCGEYQRTKDALAILDEVQNAVDQTETEDLALDIAQQFKTAETMFLNILKLLNEDYRAYQEQGLTDEDQTKNIVNENLKHLPNIQEVTEKILTAISERIDKWHVCPTLADIFLEYGPSLKVYADYMVGHESRVAKIKQMRQDDPKFDDWNKTFETEKQEQCENLPIEELFSAPVSELPFYQLLLTEYLEHLTIDCGEYRRTEDALAILDEIISQVDQVKTDERLKKTTFQIIQELLDTESNYLSILRLLNQEYRDHQSQGLTYGEQSYFPMHVVNENLRHLPEIQEITEKILAAISNRVKNWHYCPAVADIFIEWGPSLKLYITYMAGYQSKLTEFKQLRKKSRKFDKWTKSFEAEWHLKCQNLPIEEMLCAPVQRLPRYRLLLTEYMKHLPVDCGEYRRTKAAIAILHAINNQADHTVREYASMQRLLNLHSGRITDFDAFKPGRYLIKDGKLEKWTDKMGKKRLAPRWLYLFSDAVLCTTPDGDKHKINYYLSITHLTVSIPEKETVPNEFTVSSKEQSLILSTSTREDRDDWVKKIQKIINESMPYPTTHSLVSSAHCLITPVLQLEESVEISDILEIMDRGKWEEKAVVLRRNRLYISTPHKDLGDEVQIPVQGCEVLEIDEWYEDDVLQSVFTLAHGNAVRKLFKAKSPTARERWMKAFRAVTGPEIE